MEYDTGHHLGYMFLTGAQRIDHSTFSKFLSKFKTEVVALFSQIVLVCVEQGFLDALRHRPCQRQTVHLEPVIMELAEAAGRAGRSGWTLYVPEAQSAVRLRRKSQQMFGSYRSIGG